MSEQPIPSRLPSIDEARLRQFFIDAESQQLNFLNDAGKRIVELSSVLLGVLFSIAAFGEYFPPVYLVGSPLVKTLMILALLGYLAALAAGLATVQPRNYRYNQVVSVMAEEYERAVQYKRTWFRTATTIFGIASLLLVALLVIVIWNA